MDMQLDRNEPAFIGMSFDSKVIYNVVDMDGEFDLTGMSIIQYLKNNKNKFIAQLLQSQSYDSIKYILDDDIVFGEHYDNSSMNIDTFQKVLEIMKTDKLYDYFYVYDLYSDLLIMKTPNEKDYIALDYKDSEVVRQYINTNKGNLNGKF